jgi:hypothetical protein
MSLGTSTTLRRIIHADKIVHNLVPVRVDVVGVDRRVHRHAGIAEVISGVAVRHHALAQIVAGGIILAQERLSRNVRPNISRADRDRA